MGRIFYIADTHFGHKNIISYDGRPFFTAKEMEDELVKRWNQAVTEPTDTVYILGDFCWDGEDEWIRILERLNGKKVLILGNHDLKTMGKTLSDLFLDVKDYAEIIDHGSRVVMSHYPLMFYMGASSTD